MEKYIKRLILLFSLILVIIPMVIFPKRLGMPLMSGSALYILYEMVFYGVVLFIFRREATLATVLAGSALTLVYRMVLGAAFGLAIIVMYGLDISIAFSLGMGKYLPAVLLHVAAAPFVMRPVYLGLAASLAQADGAGRDRYRRPLRPPVDRETTVPFPPRLEEKPVPSLPGRARLEPVAPAPVPETENQFDRAIAYVAESGAVKMALLIDEEGLPLARFSRCDEDYEIWAPLTNILEGKNREILNRYRRGGDPEKIDIGTRNVRIVVRRIEHLMLMVLADQGADETILIRIAQAADMIRKYMNERYSPALFARVEERYVSNS